MAKRLFSRFNEDLIITGLLFVVYLAAGAYLAMGRHYLPGDTLARLVSAWLAVAGTQAKLATIGFIWPPIPTMLIIPFTLIPGMVTTWMAVVIVSALFMAISGAMVARLARLSAVTNPWRLALVVLFACNPLILIFGANGMTEAVLIAFTLMAFYWFLRFQRSDRNLDMLVSAIFFGMLPLIRYEALLYSVAAILLLFSQSYLNHRDMKPYELRDFLEGRTLAFSAPMIYPMFLWVVANWQIMGNPLYFLTNDRSAVSSAGTQLTQAGLYGISLIAALTVSFNIWGLTFPLGMLIIVFGVGVALWRRSVPLLGISLLPLINPLLLGLLLYRGSQLPLMRYYIITIPFAVVVGMAVWQELDSAAKNLKSSTAAALRIGFLAGYLLLFAVSNVVTARSLSNTDVYKSIEGPTWINLVTPPGQEVAIEPDIYLTDALAVGKALTQIIPPGKRVLVDTYGRGYAVLLGSGNAKLFLDHTDPNYDQAILHPWEFADYVLLPDINNDEIFGWLDAINQAHPSLYNNGATWAEQVTSLQTRAGWKLFRVKRTGPSG